MRSKSAASHALFWLFMANGVGVLLSAMLLWPELNLLFGPWAYGRWVPVHLNLQLYGWTSLPLIAWLLRVYEAEESWAVWAWSGALLFGAFSWLMGRTSGKIFLDWVGGALFAFVAAMLFLWGTLARSFLRQKANLAKKAVWCRGLGLAALLPIPFLLAWSANPRIYPQFDHTTGGPTGSSLLGSTLGVVIILLLLPRAWPLPRLSRASWPWWLAAGELAVFFILETRGGTHFQVSQILGLALLLPWPWVIGWDWCRFVWPESTAAWRRWTLRWWAVLVFSGWLMYLPKILDRLKFTDGLVAHAHLAMAGFTSALGLTLLALTNEDTAKVINIAWPRRIWNLSVLGLISTLSLAGWREGIDPTWTTNPPALRGWLYGARLFFGFGMFAIAARWWWLSCRDFS